MIKSEPPTQGQITVVRLTGMNISMIAETCGLLLHGSSTGPGAETTTMHRVLAPQTDVIWKANRLW